MGGSEVSESDTEANDKPGEESGERPDKEGDGKIQRNLKSMMKQMQLSEEEIKYRMENFDNVDVVKEYLKYLKCTKCNLNFQQFIKRGDTIGIHPFLGVLMCDSCCEYYGDGNFSLDSEGEDKYCRWCGEGGTIFACSKCICGFCDVCINKHFGEEGVEAVKNDDDWICYFCNPQPLWYLRSICSLAKEAAQNKRDHLKKEKESASVKKRRRKVENDFSRSSSESSNTTNSISSIKKKRKRKKLLRATDKLRRDESSSSEYEKENYTNSNRRVVRSKNQSMEEDMNDKSSECNSEYPKKKAKISSEENEFENKKAQFLQKLKSIWRLTQTITQVGFTSSRDRLKSLSKSKFDTIEHLKKEHEDLKSCMDVLVSSLNTASNSVNSIKEDLTFDTTKDETESFRSQEIRLKTFAEKFHEESDDKTSVDSEGDSFRKENKEREGRKKQPVKGRRKSVRETVKKKRESKENTGEVNSGGENKSRSLFSDSSSDEDKKGKKRSGNQGSRDSGKASVPAKPLLKVKSFARMLDENVYDKEKGKKEESAVVIDLYEIDTDESEGESKKKELPAGEVKNDARKQSSKTEKNSSEEPEKEKLRVNGEGNKENGKVVPNNEDKLEKSPESEALNKKSSESEGVKKNSRGRKKKKCSTDENNSSASEDGKSSSEKSDGGKEKKRELRNKNKKKGRAENQEEDKSSGNEKPSDGETESPDDKTRTTRKKTRVKNQKSKKTTESESDDRNEENRDEEMDQNNHKEETSEGNGEKVKEPDVAAAAATTATANGDDDAEENLQKKDEEPKDSDDNEDLGKTKANTPKSVCEGEGERESSNNEREKEKNSEDKREDSSDSESKKSTDEEKNTIKTRRQKKEVKVSFEKFKRKRERFLKSCKENSQPEKEKEEMSVTKALESSESESEKKETVRIRGRPRKKLILASSDEENEGTGEKSKEATSSEESEKENQENQESEPEVKLSSGSESSSEEEAEKKNRKRIKKRQKVSSDSSEEEGKRKKKRGGSSSDSSGDEKTKKRKKGRKNIKKILKKDSLQVETKEALKNEEERKKRLKERQKLFEELFPQNVEEGEPKQLILDFNPETKEPLVTVHKKLVKKLKPHQMKGVKFMWDNCFESVQKLEEESGSGCILAHCMGLGKTLQVITLVHTAMTHDLGVNTVLIVCPLSTVSNWIREFETWLGNIHTEPIILFDLVKYKKRDERLFYLKDWHESGGVLVLSYDLFRNLTKTAKKEKKKKPKYQQIFEKTLLDPGPDLVVCDEGHLLKNEDTALSKCMSRVKTSRRIVLTGTPLQNNLIEYHCMVQFVKPNILGTRKEFCNRFVNPINNGQFEDSTELDVKIMKRRSHVLHSMLEGCIQRFDYSVLTPFLPEKHEYVLSISLTDTQAKAYLHFINNLSVRSSSGSSRAATLFNDYHSLQRIWTHPRTMLMQSEKENQKDDLERDSEGSLKDFVVSSSEETEETGSETSEDSIQEVPQRKRILRSNANDPEVKKAIEEEEKLQNKHWWDEFYEEKAYDDLRESNKLVILFSLLKYCAQKKDKLLVFSQSLYSLDLIEYFLSRIDQNNKKNEETLCGHRDSWVLGSDYFRLDGSTNSEMRAIWCKHFNKESNTRARLFLISTRAGGLGINLYGANRVVIFDASWNPSHDLQSIFRVYRFGQKKTCYIYRFLSEATMEEKIYERQVTKLSLAHRVVDEHQIERHYTMGNLQELYSFQPTSKDVREVPKLPKDSVLADILAEHRDIIVRYHEHDSLLENKQEEELTEEERKAAWKEYEDEKTQKAFNFNAAMEQQIVLMQQAQFVQGGPGVQVLNPAALNQGQSFINPMYIQTNVPLETLQRGVRVGVTPLPNESYDSYLMRIYNREAWLQVRQTQGQ